MSKFQPTLSAIYTLGYNMDTSLIPKLEPHSLNEATTKDLFSFSKQITKYDDSSLCMASFIVESLFTNILLNETINNCVSDLHTINLYNGKLSKRHLSKVLEKQLINILLF